MNPYQHERKIHTGVIKMRKDHFVLAFLAFGVFEVIALISPFFMEKSLIVFAMVIPMFMLYISLSYFNEKMIYDDDGITFINMWNRSEHLTWNEVVVEDTFETSHTMRRFPVRVVNIRYKNARGRMLCMRYQFNDYLGIEQFLLFYTHISSSDNYKQR